jgi:phosphomannomutase
LAIETSGHAAMKENHFLDDGAYLVSKLLIELAKSKLAGKSLSDLIANLKEPVESAEFRLKIGVADFKAHGQQVIEQTRLRLLINNPIGRLCPITTKGSGWLARLRTKMVGFCCDCRCMIR